MLKNMLFSSKSYTNFYYRHHMNVEALVKENESLILGSIGVITVLFILGGAYFIWAKPRFLYMPIYASYEKDSDIAVNDEDDIGTEMKEGQRGDIIL